MMSSLKIPKEEWDRLYSLRDKGVDLINKTKTAAKEGSKVLDEAQDLVKKSEVLKNAMSDTDKSKR